MLHAYITDIGGFLPNAPVTNDDIETVLGAVGGRPSRARRITLRNNGIQTRYYAIDPRTGCFTHNNAQLTAEAVRDALRRADLPLERIGLLSCGTSSPDQIKPAHANMVHGELCGPACEVVSTAGVCASGMAALKYAWLAVAAGQVPIAISTGSEHASSFMRAANFEPEVEARTASLESHPELAFEKDFLRWMLSDGAGAVLIRGEPNADRLSLHIDWVDTVSFAGELPACMYSGAIKREDGSLHGWREADPAELLSESYFAVKQDARLLNDHIVSITVDRALMPIVARRGLKPQDIDWFLPHYSSDYFRSRLHDGLVRAGFPLPYERWFTNLTSKGNVGSAAIYLILQELFYSGRLVQGQRILCCVPESARFAVAYMHLTVL